MLVTTMPVILINANAATQGPWRALDWIGFVIFAAGFTMETIADRQKRSFKADAKNKEGTSIAVCGVFRGTRTISARLLCGRV